MKNDAPLPLSSLSNQPRRRSSLSIVDTIHLATNNHHNGDNSSSGEGDTPYTPSSPPTPITTTTTTTTTTAAAAATATSSSSSSSSSHATSLPIPISSSNTTTTTTTLNASANSTNTNLNTSSSKNTIVSSLITPSLLPYPLPPPPLPPPSSSSSSYSSSPMMLSKSEPTSPTHQTHPHAVGEPHISSSITSSLLTPYSSASQHQQHQQKKPPPLPPLPSHLERKASLVPSFQSFHSDTSSENVTPLSEKHDDMKLQIGSQSLTSAHAMTNDKDTQTPTTTSLASSSRLPHLTLPNMDKDSPMSSSQENDTPLFTPKPTMSSMPSSSSKNNMFHATFKTIPPHEHLIEDFSCALQKEILVQGRLYLTNQHLCFNAVLFGWTSSLLIAFSDVTAIEKKSTALIFPNAIEITTIDRKYFFASFIFREQAFNLIYLLWCKVNPNAPVIPLSSAPSTVGPRGHHHHHPQRTLERYRSTPDLTSLPQSSSNQNEQVTPLPRFPRQVSLDQLSNEVGMVEEETIFDVSESEASSWDFDPNASLEDDDGQTPSLVPPQHPTLRPQKHKPNNHKKTPAKKKLFSGLPKSLSFASGPPSSSSSLGPGSKPNGYATLRPTRTGPADLSSASASSSSSSNSSPDVPRDPTSSFTADDQSVATTCTCTPYDTPVFETMVQGLRVRDVYRHLYHTDGTTPNAMHQYLVDTVGCTSMQMPPFPTTSPPTPPSREITYVLPIKAGVPMAPKQTSVLSKETVLDHSATHLVVQAITQTPDVPTGPHFAVHSLVCFLQTEPLGVRVSVSAKVVWTKQVWMLKSVVETGTLDGQKKHWAGVVAQLAMCGASATASARDMRAGACADTVATDTARVEARGTDHKGRANTAGRPVSAPAGARRVSTGSGALHPSWVVVLGVLHLVLFGLLFLLHRQLSALEAKQAVVLEAVRTFGSG